MAEPVTLTCPNCAGRLEIPPDVDRFACAHCGTELNVKRGGGIILLNPVIGSVPKIESSIGHTAEPPQVQSGVERTAAEMAKIQSGLERTAAEPPQGQPGVERTAAEMAKIQSGLERTAAEPPQGQAGVERTASEMAKIQSGLERTAAEPAKGQSETERTAAAQAIQRLESEINAISGQLNDLTVQMQQALADLAAPPPTMDEPPVWEMPAGSVPFYLQWFQGRAWWKSLLGGVVILTALSCLFLCAVAVVDPGQTKITNQTTDGTTVSKEERTLTDTSTAILCLCCAAYPVLLLFVVYGALTSWSRQKKTKRKNEELLQGQGPVEQDARRAGLVRDFQTRRAPLETELERKKRQLAEQRRILGG
jgi:hypothetical protein